LTIMQSRDLVKLARHGVCRACSSHARSQERIQRLSYWIGGDGAAGLAVSARYACTIARMV
jgi:hypothetical protein